MYAENRDGWYENHDSVSRFRCGSDSEFDDRNDVLFDNDSDSEAGSRSDPLADNDSEFAGCRARDGDLDIDCAVGLGKLSEDRDEAVEERDGDTGNAFSEKLSGFRNTRFGDCTKVRGFCERGGGRIDVSIGCTVNVCCAVLDLYNFVMGVG